MADIVIRHRRGNRHLSRAQEYLKPIVYGGNDGIVTTFAIVAGFAGASAEGAVGIGALAVLVFGLANLFADAVSMGLGEFLSGRSQRELYIVRHRSEQAAMRAAPDASRAALEGLFRDRGLSGEDAVTAAGIVARHPGFAADLRLAYTYELTDPRSTRPAADGLITFAAFVALGAVPLLPYLFGVDPDSAFGLSVAATICALILLGLLRWHATDGRLWRSVAETVLVGGTCALVAYLVGALVAGV